MGSGRQEPSHWYLIWRNFFISCLLLHNKLPSTFDAWNIHTLSFSHNFCGSRIWNGLVEWFWLWASHKVTVKKLTRTAVIWRLHWSWRMHLQDGLFTWLAGWCWSVGALSSLLHGLLHRAAWEISWHGPGFPRESSTGEQGGNGNIFYYYYYY